MKTSIVKWAKKKFHCLTNFSIESFYDHNKNSVIISTRKNFGLFNIYKKKFRRFLDSVFTFKSVIFAVMVGARAHNKGNNGIAHSVIIGLVRLGKQFCSVKKGHQIQPAVCKCGQIVKNAFKPHNSVIGQVTNYMNKILFTHQLITSQFINNRYGIMEKNRETKWLYDHEDTFAKFPFNFLSLQFRGGGYRLLFKS